MFAMIAYAQEAGSAITIVPLLNRINNLILNPIIILLFAVAITVFLWGVVQFLSDDGTGDRREQGKKHMLWGVVGLFIMFGVYGIITLIIETFGISFEQKPPYLP